MAAGPFPVLCLMIGTVVTRLVPGDGVASNITGLEGLSVDEQRVVVASSVTFLAGLMQVRLSLHQQPIRITDKLFLETLQFIDLTQWKTE